MASLFSKDPGERKPLSTYAPERIEGEVAHLKKRGSVRDAKETRRTLGIWVSILAVAALVWLFCMDPLLYSFKRGDAIHAYLYLHSFGSEAKATAVAATGIITPNEVTYLNQRQGTFQDYFPTPARAAEVADSVIGYMKGVTDLHSGRYDRLDRIGKLRYQLFVRWGLHPPIHWDFLDPSPSE